MLQHLQWRVQVGADSIMDWTPPEVLQRFYPGGLCGHDKCGRPIWIEPLGFTDVRGVKQFSSIVFLLIPGITDLRISLSVIIIIIYLLQYDCKKTNMYSENMIEQDSKAKYIALTSHSRCAAVLNSARKRLLIFITLLLLIFVK